VSFPSLPRLCFPSVWTLSSFYGPRISRTKRTEGRQEEAFAFRWCSYKWPGAVRISQEALVHDTYIRPTFSHFGFLGLDLSTYGQSTSHLRAPIEIRIAPPILARLDWSCVFPHVLIHKLSFGSSGVSISGSWGHGGSRLVP
jgi:hypothetical protein